MPTVVAAVTANTGVMAATSTYQGKVIQGCMRLFRLACLGTGWFQHRLHGGRFVHVTVLFS